MAIPSEVASKFWAKAKENIFFHGWSNVVIHLRPEKGCLVVFNHVDYTTFKVTYFIDGVIPERILPKSYDDTSNDIISTINIGNKTFHVKNETLDGKVCFTNGIDVIVAQFQLESGCYLLFTIFFGNYFHVRIFGKNGVEINFAGVEVDGGNYTFGCFFIYLITILLF
ncbi:putative DNA-binding pseudobarrel domain superfamily [Helianthus anomalus]